MNQYVKLPSVTGLSKMQLFIDNKLILEMSYNPLSGKENEMKIQ